MFILELVVGSLAARFNHTPSKIDRGKRFPTSYNRIT